MDKKWIPQVGDVVRYAYRTPVINPTLGTVIKVYTSAKQRRVFDVRWPGGVSRGYMGAELALVRANHDEVG